MWKYILPWGLICVMMLMVSDIKAQSKANAGEKAWEFNAEENMVAPVFANGKIYVGNSKVMYCLDAQTGKKNSEFNVEVKQPILSLLVDNNKLYTWGWAGQPRNIQGGLQVEMNIKTEVCCFDVKTGKKIWEYTGPAGTRFALPPLGPALYKGKLFVPGGCSEEPGGFTCLDAQTGKTLWKDSGVGVMHSAPVVYNDYIYVTTVCPLNTIRCYQINGSTKKDTVDIKLKWEFPGNPTSSHCENSISIYKNKAYRYGTHLSRFDLTPDQKKPKVTELSNPPSSGSQAALAQDAERLYVSLGNELYCLDKTDEQKGGNPFSPGGKLSFPAVAGGKIYVGCENNNLYCVDVKTGNKLWEFTCEDLIEHSFSGNSGVAKKISAPILAKGKIYLTGGKKLYCIESGDSKTDGWYVEGGGPERGGYNRNELK